MTTGACAQKQRSTNHWFVGLNGVMISFFGDLSTKDYNPVWKTQTESDFGMNLLAGKEIGHYVFVSGNFIYGRMKGNNPSLNSYFNSTFTELQATAGLSIYKGLLSHEKSPFDLKMNFGAGQLFYKSLRRLTDGTIVNDEGFADPAYKGVYKSSLFLSAGFEMSYNFIPQLALNAGLSFRFTNSDLLDSYSGSTGISDRYSILSLGFIYEFNLTNNSYQIRCTEEYKKFKIRK